MRLGYWMPVFGGWLRNVRDQGMSIAWPYVRSLAVESEQHGFELSLIAELNLNDRQVPVQLDGAVLEPKPSRLPPVCMGGESPKAKEVIAAQADAYVMPGDAPEVIAQKVADLNGLRAGRGRPHAAAVLAAARGDGPLRRAGDQPLSGLGRVLAARVNARPAARARRGAWSRAAPPPAGKTGAAGRAAASWSAVAARPGPPRPGCAAAAGRSAA